MDRIHSFSNDSDGVATVDLDRLNMLLGCELAAVESYTEAMARLANHWSTQTFEHIRNNHRDSAEWLRERIRSAGQLPMECPGLWCGLGSFVDSHELIGMATILTVLKQGEQHLLNEFEDVVRTDDVEEETRHHIAMRSIPNGERHLLELDHMLAHDGRV